MQSGAERLEATGPTTVRTGRGYDELTSAFESTLGRLDPSIMAPLVRSRAAWSEVERAVARMAGEYGLMIVAQANQGDVVSLTGKLKRCSLFLVGNPVIAASILEIDLRASLYVPFRVSIFDDGDERGAAISIERPSTFLATLGHPELDEIAASLDAKIDAVLEAIKTFHP